MKKCENCSKPLFYKDILNSILFSYKDVECSSCKTVHYVNLSTRIITSVAIVLPLLLFAYLARSIGYYTIVLYIVWLIVVFSIMPYIASYKAKNRELNTLKK